MLGRRPRYTYPFPKVCEVCNATFEVNNRYQAARNKTCSKECNGKLISIARMGKRIPLELREGREVVCTVCGKTMWRPSSQLKKIKSPMCSRECNGKMRGKEWGKHAHKARAAWSAESEAKLKERMTGDTNPAWKGGVTYHKRKGNYQNQSIKHVLCPKEFAQMERKDGYVMEHRLKVAITIGRPLTRLESVHHINHNATDNRTENLMLFSSNAGHKQFEGGWEIKPLWCGVCGHDCLCKSGDVWRFHLPDATTETKDPRQLEIS